MPLVYSNAAYVRTKGTEDEEGVADSGTGTRFSLRVSLYLYPPTVEGDTGH
jgi:hypothetical protein